MIVFVATRSEVCDCRRSVGDTTQKEEYDEYRESEVREGKGGGWDGEGRIAD